MGGTYPHLAKPTPTYGDLLLDIDDKAEVLEAEKADEAVEAEEAEEHNIGRLKLSFEAI